MAHYRIRKLILFAGDLLVLYAALFLSLTLRAGRLPDAGTWVQNFEPFSWLFLVWLAVFYTGGLYDVDIHKNDVGFYNRVIQMLAISYGIAAAYFYLLTDKLFQIKPQTVFFIYMAAAAVLLPLWRYFYNAYLHKPARLRDVLVIGMKDEARELIEEIIRKPQLGFRISVIIHDGYQNHAHFPGVKILDSAVNMRRLVREHKITTVVTALDPHQSPELTKQLYECLSLRLQFFDLPRFYEQLTGKIPVTSIGRIWFLENLAEAEKTAYEHLKRLLDAIFSAVVLLLFLPFAPLVALAIKLGNPGPVFFRQTRVGILGKPFRVVKFRSMIHGAEENGPQWAQKNDKRITRMGRLLRSTRIDEIPQLWNVLRGEMSLIGPRPERPEFVKHLQEIIPFYNERHLIKPGLTGWAQINFQYGASAGEALKKLQYDLYYVKNRSVPLDFGIMLKTAGIMLGGKGR